MDHKAREERETTGEKDASQTLSSLSRPTESKFRAAAGLLRADEEGESRGWAGSKRLRLASLRALLLSGFVSCSDEESEGGGGGSGLEKGVMRTLDPALRVRLGRVLG
jgi:hypothetical protein